MTREELNGARKALQALREAQIRLKTLKISAANLVPILDGMPKAPNRISRVEELAIKICAAEEEIKNLRGEFGRQAFDLQQKISETNLDTLEKSILILRYSVCLDFKKIQNELNLGENTTFYLHREALKKIFKADSS